MGKYKRAWGSLQAPLKRAVAHAPRTDLVLHLPKTGGSSLHYAIKNSPALWSLSLPLSDVDVDGCECGADVPCLDHRKRTDIRSWTPDDAAGRPLVLKFGHEDYRAVDWVRRSVGAHPADLPVILSVRPCRSRLRSMFTDYWTQFAVATGQVVSDEPLTPHRRRAVAKYKTDALHYRDEDGRIDGISWFTAFGRYGPGVPFFLTEVFAGDPRRLRNEIQTGSLRMATTAHMGSFIEELTGISNPTRRRTSNIAHDPAVEAALADAAHLIDELARRDAEFDRIIGEHLGDDAFLQP